jgi:hypothetical protein
LRAVAGCGVGYLAGRRWRARRVRAGLAVVLLVLALSAVACGVTLSECSEAREHTRGRLEGRIPGPHLPPDRGENHLAFVRRSGLAGEAILAATAIGSGFLYALARRRSGGKDR